MTFNHNHIGTEWLGLDTRLILRNYTDWADMVSSLTGSTAKVE